MTAGASIVVAVRLIVPLLILRKPLAGGIAAVIVDTLDVVAIDAMHLGGFEGHYHTTDKLLDSYYLSLEAFVALGWENAWAKWPAVALFAYRMCGVLLFEATQARIVLFIFPNLFENWWLYCVAVAAFWPRLTPRSAATTLVPLALLLAPKMAQEYVLHFSEAQPWDWIKRHTWDP